MCRGELPAAEMSYFEAGWSPPGKKVEQWFCKEKFPVLACNARFQSLRGMLDGQLEGPETISPIQREFIRLAQIFKSRLIVELQYKQRIMERAVIEDRLGDRLKELREARDVEDAAKRALLAVQETLATQRKTVTAAIVPIIAYVDAADAELQNVAHAPFRNTNTRVVGDEVITTVDGSVVKWKKPEPLKLPSGRPTVRIHLTDPGAMGPIWEKRLDDTVRSLQRAQGLCKRPAEHVGRSPRRAGVAGRGDQAGCQRWGRRARRSSSLAPGSIAGRRVSTSRR